jgi:hypothetical protein
MADSVEALANTWRWRRTPDERWRIVERVNANLDGTPGPREMLRPAEAGGRSSGKEA